MRHGSSHGDPKQETSLNITREIKAWKAGSAVTLQRHWKQPRSHLLEKESSSLELESVSIVDVIVSVSK